MTCMEITKRARPLALLLMLQLFSAALVAQTRLSFSLNAVKAPANRYYVKPYIYPTKRQMDYSNYPLTTEEIEAKRSGVRAYNHFSNLVSNKNRNGLIGNLLGLQRTTPRNNPAPPKF